MPLLLLHPLASSDIPFGLIIFGLMWFLVIAVSLLQKWQENQRRRQMQRPPMQQQPRPAQTPQPRVQPRPANPRPQAARSQPRPAQRPPAIPKLPPLPKRIPPRVTPKPVLVANGDTASEVLEGSVGSESAARMNQELGSGTAGVPPTRAVRASDRSHTISAASLRQAVQPDKLRKQILIAEILQKPLALRER